mmetsp:Transcript_20029/g.36148  ORF Transcript_20029/g.36148 Transcript_20029/m.36148 type:complete len:661 (-) Transcript_20029:218-2200(-)
MAQVDEKQDVVQQQGGEADGRCDRDDPAAEATSHCSRPRARTTAALIIAVALTLCITVTSVATNMGMPSPSGPGKSVPSRSCLADTVRANYISAVKQEPDVKMEMVLTIQDYVLQNTDRNINARYRTRTWCDGTKNASDMCDGLGIFGPPIVIRPGDWLRIKIRNEIDVTVAKELGPDKPTLDEWYALANNETGRYAGLQECGFEFIGQLPASPKDFKTDKTNMPGHHHDGFEGTNLHLHGLEVIPHLFEPVGTEDVDADMIVVDPGTCMTYDFQIPPTQPSGGTYWYHPHLHSSVAIQAWSGMAGLIKVLGPMDDLLQSLGVVQDLPFAIWDPHFRVMSDPSPGLRSTKARELLLGPRTSLGTDFFLNAQTDQSLVYYLVNAEVQPTFKLQPGETVRFRVLCATTENLAGFEIVDTSNNATIPFWRIGSDGIMYSAPVKDTRLVLAGGMREEILVTLPKSGTYQVVSRGLTRVQFFCTGPADAVLANIVVEGDEWAKPLDIPTISMPTPPKKAIQPEEIVESRTLTLSMKADRSKVPFPQFMQNGKPYNESDVEFKCKSNTAEEWIVFNPDRTMHPLHIHVAPFQVKEVHSHYLPEEPAMQVLTSLNTSLDNWRDTVVVPSMGYVKLWLRWGNWTGKTVAHCHFLAHEDTGMIMNILVE